MSSRGVDEDGQSDGWMTVVDVKEQTGLQTDYCGEGPDNGRDNDDWRCDKTRMDPQVSFTAA
jgi:hypothetical protein